MLGLRSMFAKMLIAPRLSYQPVQAIHLTEIDYRARVGTRVRKAKIAKENRAKKLAKIAKIGNLGLNKRHG